MKRPWVEVCGGMATVFSREQQRELGQRGQYVVPGAERSASVTIYSVLTCGQVERIDLDPNSQTAKPAVRIGTEGHIRNSHLTRAGGERHQVLNYRPLPRTPAPQGRV